MTMLFKITVAIKSSVTWQENPFPLQELFLPETSIHMGFPVAQLVKSPPAVQET